MHNDILVVEDDAAIRELVCITLARSSFTVREACDAASAQTALTQAIPDLAIIDWMMPAVSGIELIRRVRRDANTRDLPIIMLTARSDENDLVQGLDSGADDFISKPFSPRELVSRVKALLRRRDGHNETGNLVAGSVVLDTRAHRVTVAGTPIALGPSEFKLLKFLLAHPDRVYSRAQLLDCVWGRLVYIEERTVDVHILRLRKALKSVGAEHLIDTVRGTGYRLSAPSRR